MLHEWLKTYDQASHNSRNMRLAKNAVKPILNSQKTQFLLTYHCQKKVIDEVFHFWGVLHDRNLLEKVLNVNFRTFFTGK